MRRTLVLLSLFFLLADATAALAQHLKSPQASPRARTEETFGITDVAIEYHRPSVNNRRIVGGLVPYDVIWRAGANENTLITLSTPVKVEGQPLAAGTYSFFFIPGQQEWTAVFNKFTGGWGTYSYDASEDALRVKTKPATADMQERLAYTFDENKPDSVTLNMRWETVRVPLHITADTKALVSASMNNQLRSELHWDPYAWTEAARWAFRNGDNDKALEYVNHAVEMMPDANNLRFKARILEKKGDAASKDVMARAAQLASPDMVARSSFYTALGQKKYDDAAATAEKTLAADPKSWRANVMMGDLLAAKGDQAKAQEWYAKAMALAPGQSEKVEVQDSINAMMAEKVEKK